MVVELPERPNTNERKLRRLAESLDVPEGYRVEILGGNIVVSPHGSSVHSITMIQIAEQLGRQLPDEFERLVEYDVESADDHDYEPAPDVVVVPRPVVDEDLPRVEADAVEMVVEIVSRGNWKTDHTTKTAVYARWNIPIYLLVDPREGSTVLHHDPDPARGEYQATHRQPYGATVELPDPLGGVRIDTSGFRLYKSR
ncbi:Uma2 family endonuclease [Lipingzhangella halophila]|uniref:Uma2 family endonuclease n=1 Tax=Lipingzhangella halophila TaxID=1783352 RepID=A0A7W7RKG3_9ACTN|nr:Uma2 family endonuclease [Lipingzhangella halophila]MBB4933472.1 Uma2 family endonuclease [Lipingzhangella halophila]